LGKSKQKEASNIVQRGEGSNRRRIKRPVRGEEKEAAARWGLNRAAKERERLEPTNRKERGERREKGSCVSITPTLFGVGG